MLTKFIHLVTHELLYAGDCKLLGVTDDDDIYVEELYGDDDWLAQHRVLVDDGIVETVDEAEGNNLEAVWLTLPDDLIATNLRNCCDILNYTGARLRGIYEDERIDDVVLPLTVQNKIELVEFMEWDVNPMQLIGIAESVVLSHTQVEDTMIVCRRVRVAYRLLQPTDTHDYDSLDVYVLHSFMPEHGTSSELVDCLNDIDDVVLLRPMDCLFHKGRLYIADGGDGDDVSAIHIFEFSDTSDKL